MSINEKLLRETMILTSGALDGEVEFKVRLFDDELAKLEKSGRRALKEVEELIYQAGNHLMEDDPRIALAAWKIKLAYEVLGKIVPESIKGRK